MTKELTKNEPQELDLHSALLEVVKRPDIDPERMEKFLDLQIKIEDRQAKKQFYEAMAGFQDECPIITRSKKVSFKSVDYSYAPLDEMVYVIKPVLKKFGLAFSFNTENKTDKLTDLHTKITHTGGHFEVSQLEFDTIHDDDRMNSSQRRKSALSYFKRAGLENALGIVTQGDDDDAVRSAKQGISEEQIKTIKQLMIDTDTTEDKFFHFLQTDSLSTLSSSDAKRAINALKQKGMASV